MSYLLTWNLCTHSPSISTVLYSLGPSIHMPGECMGREQSRIGILIRLITNVRISFLFPSAVDTNTRGFPEYGKARCACLRCLIHHSYHDLRCKLIVQ